MIASLNFIQTLNMNWRLSQLLLVFLVISTQARRRPRPRVLKRADAESIQFPGVGDVSNCPESSSCVPMNECSSAFQSGDRSKYPPICKWEVHNPKVCCPHEETKAKLEKPKVKFPEEDCAEAKVVQRPGLSSSIRVDRDLSQIAVVGGSDVTNINVYPFMAAIYQTAEDKRAFLCGGTLLSKTVVLTAAHCFLAREPTSKYMVELGSIHFQTSGVPANLLQFAVTSIKIHSRFKYPQLYNDIALVKFKGLSNYSEDTKPVCLMHKNEDKKVNSKVTVLGWGSKELGGNPSSILQEADIDVIRNSDCNSTLANLGVLGVTFPDGITNKVLCAGSSTDVRKDACQGDSGGPAVALVNGIWRQRGIVSGGIGCGIPGNPGLYTRVSEYESWIESNA